MAKTKPGSAVKVIILTVVVLALVGVAGLAAYGHYYSNKYASVLNMTIEDQPLQLAMNGPHLGVFTYGDFVYEVEVTIMYHEITDIKIISNRSSRHARQAEAVVERVLAKGNVNVDAVSGATVTSKALLKAMELAISGSC